MKLRVLAFASLSFVLSAPAAAPPARADDAASLIALHRGYVGWSVGDGVLRSARITVAGSTPEPRPGASPDSLGEPDRHTVELRRELLYRSQSFAYGRDDGQEGFTGNVAWRANENGYTVTVRGRDAREQLTADVIEAEAVDHVPAATRPDKTFDGKPVAVVRITPASGAPADLYLDRSTGAVRGYAVEPDDPLEVSVVHVDAYAEFAPGKRYVSAFHYGESKRSHRITTFEPNVPVTDADLHPPAPTARWTFGEPHAVPITIAAASYGGGRSVRLDVRVNGRLGRFLFDSGAGGITLNDDFARAAGVKEVGRSSYSGVNGRSIDAAAALVDTLTVGGNTLRHVLVQTTKYGERTEDGTIGYDVLAGAIVDVDLDAKTFSVLDPAATDVRVAPGAYAFPVDLSQFHAGIPMTVAGNVLSDVWLDTGDDFFVMLPHDLEHRIVAVTDSSTYFGGVDGVSIEPARCVRLNEMQVGPYRYQKAASCFAPADVFSSDGGLIGFDFLRHFNWTFDYPHGAVVLTPNNAR